MEKLAYTLCRSDIYIYNHAILHALGVATVHQIYMHTPHMQCQMLIHPHAYRAVCSGSAGGMFWEPHYEKKCLWAETLCLMEGSMMKEASTKRVNHMISSLSHTKKQLSMLLKLVPHQLVQTLQALGAHFSSSFILGVFSICCIF